MSASSNSLVHVVVGAGAVGSGTALRLAELGHRVRVVTRSGNGPDHPSVELIAADATDGPEMARIAHGAHAVFNGANPPYSKWADLWPPIQNGLIEACETTGARLVTMGNLYAYAADGSPMHATDSLDAPTRKGTIRQAMWEQALEAHRAGRIQTTEVRASDFFGPGIGESGHLGDRFVPRLLAGKGAVVVGRPDQAHSWSYIADVHDTLVAVALDDRSLGRAWHVPTVEPRSSQQMADLICDRAGADRKKIRGLPTLGLRLAGVLSADLREVVEMVYQFDRPFVIDATETTDVFGVAATPLDQQLDETIASYRAIAPVAAAVV
ncbi:MAG: NAD-dependent epimerase/dehydratase family protein [Ilumatobacter sp.]